MNNIYTYLIKDHFVQINISRTLLAHLQSAYGLALIFGSVSACIIEPMPSAVFHVAVAATWQQQRSGR